MKKSECAACRYCLSIRENTAQCSNYDVATRLDDELVARRIADGIDYGEDDKYFARIYHRRRQSTGQGYLLVLADESPDQKHCPNYKGIGDTEPYVTVSKSRVDLSMYREVQNEDV